MSGCDTKAQAPIMPSHLVLSERTSFNSRMLMRKSATTFNAFSAHHDEICIYKAHTRTSRHKPPNPPRLSIRAAVNCRRIYCEVSISLYDAKHMNVARQRWREKNATSVHLLAWRAHTCIYKRSLEWPEQKAFLSRWGGGLPKLVYSHTHTHRHNEL